MPFQNKETIRFYTFDSFPDDRIVHAVFTRQGGVSNDPYHSLNVGGTVGDNPEHVRENSRRVFDKLGLDMRNRYDVWQVHGSSVICADNPRAGMLPYQKADVILTDRPGIILFMRFADCVPVLLYDPIRQVVGLAHAGWMGTVKRAVENAVTVMHKKYNTSPGDILAAIGPSIASHHYVVGPEVVSAIRGSFGQDAESLLNRRNGEEEAEVELDLWKANQMILENSGVKDIEISGICTACNLNDWYSHRAENGNTGRFGVLISLRE